MGKRLRSATHAPTLQNLKIMLQHQKEDLAKKEEEDLTKNEEEYNIFPPRNTKKCVVIMEGDPKPGALSGRMSFQNFNPYIEKLNEEAEFNYKYRLSTASTDKNGMNIGTENEASQFENDGSDKNSENYTSGEVFPVKETKVEIDAGRWYLSPRNAEGADIWDQSSTERGRKATQCEHDGSNKNSENEESS